MNICLLRAFSSASRRFSSCSCTISLWNLFFLANSPIFASKKFFAPFTPTWSTLISVSLAKASNPESNSSSPALAFLETEKKYYQLCKTHKYKHILTYQVVVKKNSEYRNNRITEPYSVILLTFWEGNISSKGHFGKGTFWEVGRDILGKGHIGKRTFWHRGTL